MGASRPEIDSHAICDEATGGRVNGFGRGNLTFGFGIFAESGSTAEDSPRASSRMVRWQVD